MNMSVTLKRATVYFDPDLHRAVRLKAVNTNQSISDVVNDSLRAMLSEDEEDLAAFEERASEPNISRGSDLIMGTNRLERSEVRASNQIFMMSSRTKNIGFRAVTKTVVTHSTKRTSK